jgi:DNA invertase Pin-like site-specific DNA recombinase
MRGTDGQAGAGSTAQNGGSRVSSDRGAVILGDETPLPRHGVDLVERYEVALHPFPWGTFMDTARPKLDEMLAFVRDGDAVIVHSMDRLARNLDDLRRIVRTLTGKGVRVEFVKENLTFTGEDSPMATLLLSVMGAFAEFERALILERQREGIAAARQRGVYTGRKPALTPERARALPERAAAGERKSALATEFGISLDSRSDN